MKYLELEAYSKTETYSEGCQTSSMESFCKNSYLKHILIFPEKNFID